MIYTVKANDTVIFSTASIDGDLQILDPQLEVELNAAGKFEFILPPGHRYYNAFTNMATSVTVLADDHVIFDGRVLHQKIDLYGQKTITCEGCLSYLLDSILRPNDVKIQNMSVENIFWKYLAAHNQQMGNETGKKFTQGICTVDDKAKVVGKIEAKGYGDTRSAIDQNLINKYGGWMRVRYAPDGQGGTIRYLDWLGESDRTNNQPIRFGTQLLDLEIDESSNELFTVLIPVGKNNLTIASVTQGGVDYIEALDAKQRYGTIIRSKSFSEIDNAQELYNEAVDYLTKYVNGWKTTYEIKAVDLHLLDPTHNDFFLLGDKIQVQAPLQDTLVTMTCMAINYDILNPENTTYKIGNFEGENSGGGSSSQSYTTSGGASGGSGLDATLSEYLAKLKKQVTLTDTEMSIVNEKIDIHTQELNAKIGEDNLFTFINASPGELKIGAHKLDVDGTAIESWIQLVPDGITMNGNNITFGGKKFSAAMSDSFDLKIVDYDSDLNETIISRINASREGVSISGNLIELTGTTLLANIKDEIDFKVGAFNGGLDGDELITRINANSTTLTLEAKHIDLNGETLVARFTSNNIVNMINADSQGVRLSSGRLSLDPKDVVAAINLLPSGEVRISGSSVNIDALWTEVNNIRGTLADFDLTFTDGLSVRGGLIVSGGATIADLSVTTLRAPVSFNVGGTPATWQNVPYVKNVLYHTDNIEGVIVNVIDSVVFGTLHYVGSQPT